jgi:hypothetical protein
MQIVIISDSHDNVANLEKVVNYCHENSISTMIHAGDLCAPGLVPKVLVKFSGTVHMILGNVGDHETLKMVCDKTENVEYYGEEAELELAGKKIGLVHTPVEAEALIKKGGYDLVIHGHNHQSEIREENGIKIVNPGTVGGLFNEATFAVYETESGEGEIKNLD